MVHLDIRPANVFIKSGHDIVFPCSSLSSQPQHLHPNHHNNQHNHHNHTHNHHTHHPKPLSETTDSNTLPLDHHNNHNSAANIETNNKTHEDIRVEVERSILLGEYCLKLGDLGHARHLQEHIPIIEGETRYCPRELIDLETSNVDLRQCDIFSLGMSVYELCLGRFLGSQGEEDIIEWHNIRDGILQETFCHEYSIGFVDMIKQMIVEDPKARPSAHTIAHIAHTQLQLFNNHLSPSSISSTNFQTKGGIPGSHKTLPSPIATPRNNNNNNNARMNAHHPGLPPMPHTTTTGTGGGGKTPRYMNTTPTNSQQQQLLQGNNSNPVSRASTPVSSMMMETIPPSISMPIPSSSYPASYVEHLQKENELLQVQINQLLRAFAGFGPNAVDGVNTPFPPPPATQ